MITDSCNILYATHGQSRDNVAFYEDDGVDVRFRNRLEDFRNSGYDRGHLVRFCPSTLVHL